MNRPLESLDRKLSALLSLVEGQPYSARAGGLDDQEDPDYFVTHDVGFFMGSDDLKHALKQGAAIDDIDVDTSGRTVTISFGDGYKVPTEPGKPKTRPIYKGSPSSLREVVDRGSIKPFTPKRVFDAIKAAEERLERTERMDEINALSSAAHKNAVRWAAEAKSAGLGTPLLEFLGVAGGRSPKFECNPITQEYVGHDYEPTEWCCTVVSRAWSGPDKAPAQAQQNTIKITSAKPSPEPFEPKLSGTEFVDAMLRRLKAGKYEVTGLDAHVKKPRPQVDPADRGSKRDREV